MKEIQSNILIVFFLVVALLFGMGVANAGSEQVPSDAIPAKLTERWISPSYVAGENQDNRTQEEPVLPEGTSKDWWTTVQEEIRESEYHITWQDKTALGDLTAAWQSPNRKQNFRVYYTPKGIRVIPQTQESPSWEWGLRLERYGIRDHLRPVEKAKIKASGNRISYQRGPMTEWYINTSNGLEQGFTLKNRPAHDVENQSENKELIVEMSVTGDVTPHLSEKGDRVVFETTEGKRIIDYSKLHVFDSKGKVLPAHFVLASQKLSIIVDTDGAIYPVTIDPLTSSLDWTAGSGQAGAQFGFSVSGAGDVNGDGYDDVIVGAFGYDNGVATSVAGGRVFVYHGSATGLSVTPDWTAAENIQSSAFYGVSVSGAGDVNGDGYADVIVGAPHYNSFGQLNTGWAFVYHGSASGLSTALSWTVEGNQNNAELGWSVSGAGDVNNDGYDDVIIGAHLHDNGETDEGRAFVYHGSATGLSTTPNWTAESNQVGAWFGFSVSDARDVNGDGYADVIVGAYLYDDGELDEGRVYVYHGSASGLSSTPNWTAAESNQVFSDFGFSVSGAGDVNGDGYSDIIVGANDFGLHVNGELQMGRVYVYHGSITGLSATSDWTADGNQSGDHFGISVSGAGDVNGDGFDDVIIGAHFYDNGESNEGGAFIYHGATTGLSTIPDWTAENNQAFSLFGTSVSGAGDVNGDGFADVIVGAHWYDDVAIVNTNEGRAFVYHGSPNSPPVALNDSATTNEDTAVTVNVLLNDSDPQGSTLTITENTQGTSGSVVKNTDNTFTYKPNTNFNGTDSFTYTISDGNGGTATGTVNITITAANDPPTAANDSATTAEDTPITTVNVLLNDSDPEGDTLTITANTQGTSGGVVKNTDNTFTYIPNTNFNGTDTFTYTVSDGNGGTDTATVTINITPVNDPPVAQADNGSTLEDTILPSIDVLANDSDPEGNTLTATILTQGTKGTVTKNADGTFKYVPNLNLNGTDTFTYTLSDGNGGTGTATVTVNITPVNDPPVAQADNVSTLEDTTLPSIDVLANDSDPEGDTLTVTILSQATKGTVTKNADGTFRYVPNLNLNGTDAFTYTLRDGNATATATVTISITAVQDPPVAANDTVITPENTDVINFSVLLNDSDPDNDILTVTTFTITASGTVVKNADNTFIYTPNLNFTGNDSFVYTISDGNTTATATVDIAVKPGAPPLALTLLTPIAGANNLPTGPSFSWKKTTDPDGDLITYTLCLRAGDTNFDSTTDCTIIQGVAALMGKGVTYAGMGAGAGLLWFGMVFVSNINRIKGRKRNRSLLVFLVITGLLLASCGGGGDNAVVSPAPSDEVLHAVSGLKPATTYHWKVIASDSQGLTTESEVRSFTTQ